MKYTKSMFESMIDDFRADNNPEFDDLIVDSISDETGAWIATAHDEKATYELSDDGTGNIIINYLSAR